MPDSELLAQLLALMARLTEETEGYLDRQDDPQLWYNRGYANGMAAALRELGHGERVDQTVSVDPYEVRPRSKSPSLGQGLRPRSRHGRQRDLRGHAAGLTVFNCRPAQVPRSLANASSDVGCSRPKQLFTYQ